MLKRKQLSEVISEFSSEELIHVATTLKEANDNAHAHLLYAAGFEIKVSGNTYVGHSIADSLKLVTALLRTFVESRPWHIRKVPKHLKYLVESGEDLEGELRHFMLSELQYMQQQLMGVERDIKLGNLVGKVIHVEFYGNTYRIPNLTSVLEQLADRIPKVAGLMSCVNSIPHDARTPLIECNVFIGELLALEITHVRDCYVYGNGVSGAIFMMIREDIKRLGGMSWTEICHLEAVSNVRPTSELLKGLPSSEKETLIDAGVVCTLTPGELDVMLRKLVEVNQKIGHKEVALLLWGKAYAVVDLHATIAMMQDILGDRMGLVDTALFMPTGTVELPAELEVVIAGVVNWRATHTFDGSLYGRGISKDVFRVSIRTLEKLGAVPIDYGKTILDVLPNIAPTEEDVNKVVDEVLKK